MHGLLELGATNAASVTLLAITVFLISRLYWRPALVHALWVLLFIKLVTPPIAELPIPATWLAAVWPAASDGNAVTTSIEGSGDGARCEEPRDGARLQSESGEAALRPLDPHERRVADSGAGSESRASLNAARNATPRAGSQPGVAASSAQGAGNEAKPLRDRFSLGGALCWIWLLGSSVIGLCTTARILRFRRLLRHAQPAPARFEREAQRLARELGLRRAPRLLLASVPSPMLWGLPPATIVFPADLLDILDRRSRETLLLHELAHYRRRDHWIRILEIVTTILYWWHPCVWWGRREMRAAEEECCDAWVVSQTPENRSIYARALMTVIDGLAGDRVRIPPVASGIGDFQSAANRLQTIMLGSPQREMGRGTRVAVACIAVPWLCLAPTLGQTDDAATSAAPSRPLPRTVEPDRFERLPIALNLQSERIREVAYSADGARLVAAHGDRGTSGCLRVWDMTAGQELAAFPEPRGIYSAHISPDGRLVASCSFSDRLIRVREVESERLVGEIRCGVQLARVRFSPNGKWLATASTDGKLLLWDVEQVLAGERPTLEPLREIAAVGFNLQGVAFSPDGRRIAAGGGPMGDEPFGWAGLWDVMTGEPIAQMEGMPDATLGIAVSPDGLHVATAGRDGMARLWSVETGELLKAFTRSDAPLECVEFSRDGTLLATGGYDDIASLWSVETGREVALFDGHLGDVMSVRFSPDGAVVATGGEDQVIRLWDAATHELLRKLQPASEDHDIPNTVLALACSPDGRLVATAHGDRTVRLRNIAERTVIRQVVGHGDVVTSLAFSPDGATLATASYDGTAKLWDVETGAEKRTLAGHARWVTSVAFSPDGRTLASAAYDRTVRLWDASSGEEIRRLSGHAAPVRSVAFSPDGRSLASGGSDRTIRIWDVATGEERHKLSGHTGAVRVVAFHPEGALLASASEDTTVRLWDLDSGKERSNLRAHPQMVWSLAFSPRGRTLVSGGMGGLIYVWETQTGARLQMLRDHSDVVSALAFVPGEGSLISGGYDMAIKQWIPAPAPLAAIGQRSAGDGLAASFVAFTDRGARLLAIDKQSGACRVWKAATGRLVREFQAHSGQIRSAALSPNARILAVAQTNRAIRLWDIGAATLIRELPSHGAVNSLAFSPDGQRLLATGGDGVARLWDIEDEKLVVETPAQGEELQGGAFSPDGAQFATCSGNWVRSREGQVKLWDAVTGEEIALLGGHPGRINTLQFHPDGKQLVAGTNQGGMLLVFDLERREKTAELRLDSPAAVLSLALSAEGERIAIGQASGQVSLWDLRARRKRLDYIGHTPNGANSSALVWSLAFSPDGRMLASGGYDHQGRTVRLWPTSLTEPIPVHWDGANR